MSPAGSHRSDRNKHPPFERQIWCAGQSVQGRVCGAGCAGQGVRDDDSGPRSPYDFIDDTNVGVYVGMRGKVRAGEGCSIRTLSVFQSQVVTVSVRAGCAACTRVQ